jgi:type IV pilus assembly protein PilX
MKNASNTTLYKQRHAVRQRGVALFVVIVFVMLSMLLALWAARSSLFNEILVGNDADYQRTFEAAQAMLQDAEMDIRGVKPDGSACAPVSGKTDVCRVGTAVYFDIETKDLANLLATIATTKPDVSCYKGICSKRSGSQDFWNDSSMLAKMIDTDIGARYGQFTGADTAATANPILANTTAGEGAWYWVEMMPYMDPNIALMSGMPPGANVARLAPASNKRFIYRITTLSIQKAE